MVEIKWTKEKVFEESKRFTNIKDFRILSYTAYNHARKYNWLDEMPWLERHDK